MKKILFASDFSESCENALLYVVELIKNTDIKVDILNVYDLDVKTIIDVSHSKVKSLLEEKNAAFLDKLNDQRLKLPANNRGEVIVENGLFPSSEIINCATNQNADLIVVALRQKYSIVDRMIGTVTAHTMENSKVPVLAIPNGAVFNGIKTILFPTSTPTLQEIESNHLVAVDWVKDLCAICGKVGVQLVHVDTDESLIDVNYKNIFGPNTDFFISNARTVADGILEVLEKKPIELIAIMQHNRPFWQRLYRSSVSRKILYQNRIPLLVLN